MNHRIAFTTGTLSAIALVIGGMTAEVHAQRGGGVGHAPTNVGGPTTTGRPDTAGRPATAGQAAAGKSNTNTGKPDGAGRPTIADQLTREHGLAVRLAQLFPMDTDLVEAAKGFKNLGQFVAAAHVADNNPNFTFDELKAKMLDGEDGPISLGEAIHALDPQADAEMEAETAQTQTTVDLKVTTSGK